MKVHFVALIIRLFDQVKKSHFLKDFEEQNLH